MGRSVFHRPNLLHRFTIWSLSSTSASLIFILSMPSVLLLVCLHTCPSLLFRLSCSSSMGSFWIHWPPHLALLFQLCHFSLSSSLTVSAYPVLSLFLSVTPSSYSSPCCILHSSGIVGSRRPALPCFLFPQQRIAQHRPCVFYLENHKNTRKILKKH